MKTIRFAREHNTYNEYTCDQVTDCTGDYLKKDDVLALLDRIDAQIDLEAADASTWGMGTVLVSRNLIKKLREEVE